MRNNRYNWTLLLCVALLTSCGKNAAQPTSSTWTPPNNPKPYEILYEARVDAKNGDYPAALTKQIWFYENALKYDSALAGVRLSFAITDWVNLGAAYPLALEKLKAVRDEARENVRNKAGREAYEAFMDFDAINEALKEDDKTKELFIWLDSNKPDKAKELFELAESALVKAKEYRLCGKYIDAEASLAAALKSYRMTSEIAKNPKLGKKTQDFADKKFVNTTTTLIALLVVNDRKTEAQNIVDQISKESELPQFQAEIQKALNGEIPTPWP
jgi:hypothetical protein